MMLNTYTPQQMSLPSINFLHLMVSEIQPGQSFFLPPSHRPSGHHGCKQYPDSLEGVWVKILYFYHFKGKFLFQIFCT